MDQQNPPRPPTIHVLPPAPKRGIIKASESAPPASVISSGNNSQRSVYTDWSSVAPSRTSSVSIQPRSGVGGVSLSAGGLSSGLGHGSGKHHQYKASREAWANESVSSAATIASEWADITDDVYSMLFISNFGHPASLYPVFVFSMKMTLLGFLTVDAIAEENPSDVTNKVLVTQFLMLPVAVAIQEDLIATYYTLANLKYSPLIKMHCPWASKIKFHVANIFRGLGALFGLVVNFIIVLKSKDVLNLLFNFTALQFLQTTDNIALNLAVNGYLSEELETIADKVLTCKLPKKHNRLYRAMDSVLFLSTYAALLVAWIVINFGKKELTVFAVTAAPDDDLPPDGNGNVFGGRGPT